MPFALENIRVADLTWNLAGAGGPRFMTAFGADVIKVEWKGKIDPLRMVNPLITPEDVRLHAKDAPERIATEGLPAMFNRSGMFAETNPGKRAISLNARN